MKGIFIILCLLISSMAFAESFEELSQKLEGHDLLKSKLYEVQAMQEKARQSGSWGDPKLSISAMNFPKDSLSQNESMMTGIQFGLSQKLSISGKYGKLKESGLEKAKTHQAQTKQLKREFLKGLWEISIQKERLINEFKILKENFEWVKNNLKITKRLYSTGKVPQQAVLDIQIRKSELASQIDQNKYARESLKHQLSVLLSSDKVLDIDLETMPWKSLDSWKDSSDEQDFQRVALHHNLQASDLRVSAQNRNYFPDITLGVSYTKRNDIDGIGDFVGASISIPIPTSDSRYAAKSEAVFERIKAEKSYRNYLNTKPNVLKKMEFDIKDVSNQLKVLQLETLKYAKSSRDVTAKSYSRGGADYLELLRSELQYQNQLIKEINLIANLKNKKVNYLFINGGQLKAGKEL